MKSERGVTLISIIIYVMALTITVIIISRISTYFYKNINNVSSNVSADSEYIKFNSYFTDEINIEENEVEKWDKNYIIFSKSENQYTYKNGGIYVNKIKLCKNIEFLEFYYDKDTKEISVNMKIKGKNYSGTYTVVK